MKDLVFLLLTLGLITFAMMAAQNQYYSQEAETTRQWQRDRHLQPPVSPSPSASPTTVQAP